MNTSDEGLAEPPAAEYCLAFGTATPGMPTQDLLAMLDGHELAVSLRHSSHFAGGEYVKVAAGAASLSFERVKADEVLLRGESPGLKELEQLCDRVSQALREHDVRHRLEVYDAADELVCTFGSDGAA